MANWFSAGFRFLIGVAHFFEALFKARYRIFRMASSVGKAWRFLIIFRSVRFSDSMALVV